MKKFGLLLLLCSALAVTGFGQVRPNEFVEETNPNNSNFETYSQKGGVNRRASLANLRKYFGATIVTGTAPTPTGNAESLRNRLVVVLPDSVTYFVDHTGISLKLGGGAAEVELREGPPDTLCVGANCVVLPEVPASLPPSGPAGGALNGTYPNPGLAITTLPPSGPAGGALNGTYPNPGLAITTLPPSGPAGGVLNGTYPNPGLGLNVVAWNILSTAVQDSITARLVGLGTVGVYPVWSASRRLADGRLANINGGIQVVGSNVFQLGAWSVSPSGVVGAVGYRSDLGNLTYYDGLTSTWRILPKGAGAANHIAIWSANNELTHDASQLYWDAINNRLGLGTASPSVRLHLATGGAIFNLTGNEGFTIQNINGNNFFRLQGTNGETASFTPASANFFGSGIDASSWVFGNVKASLAVNLSSYTIPGWVVSSVPINSFHLSGSANAINAFCTASRIPMIFINSGGSVAGTTVIGGLNNASANASIDNVNYGFRIIGGLGTGTGTPGDIMLLTGNVGVSGTDFHVPVVRWRIKGGTGRFGNVSDPTADWHVAGSMRLTGTYADGANSNGTAGDVLSSTGTSTSWKAQRNNVASGTTDSSGDITITFSAAMPDNTYSALITLESAVPWIVQVHSKTTTTCKVRFYQSTTGLEVAAGNSANVSYQVTDY